MHLFLLLCILTVTGAQIPLKKDECVDWHNHYRRIHQAPDMRWSSRLAADAQHWANYLAARNAFYHSSNRNGQGENLYWKSRDSTHSCREAIQAFYKEVKYYNYQGQYIRAAGHFTQVVWVKSTEIGVGKAITSGGAIILVFRYQPAGNFIGQFDENVKRPIRTSTDKLPAIDKIKTDKPPAIGRKTDKPPTIGRKTDKPPTIGKKTDKPPTSGRKADKPPAIGTKTDEVPTPTNGRKIIWWWPRWWRPRWWTIRG